jgi:hypothetical protein
MAIKDFVEGLKALGYDPQVFENGRLVFDYRPELGRFAGQVIKLGLTVGEDFPLSPPGGPRVSPRLLPLHPAQDIPHPNGAVHEAPDYGPEWEYWSRPYTSWQTVDRTAAGAPAAVAKYMRHIRNLFATIP